MILWNPCFFWHHSWLFVKQTFSKQFFFFFSWKLLFICLKKARFFRWLIIMFVKLYKSIADFLSKTLMTFESDNLLSEMGRTNLHPHFADYDVWVSLLMSDPVSLWDFSKRAFEKWIQKQPINAKQLRLWKKISQSASSLFHNWQIRSILWW